MTRETKIGLLVGLAFIIIVGILLSEPLNHAGDAQPAPLPYAGQNVRVAVVAPGSANTPPAPLISNQTQAGGANAQQPVPTQNEVTKQPPGGITVEVEGGASGSAPHGTPRISMEQPAPPQPQQQQVQQTTLSNNNSQAEEPQHAPVRQPPTRGNGKSATPGRTATPPPSNTAADPIFGVAHSGGEELVSTDGRPLPGGVNGTSGKTTKATAKPARQYEAAGGDTLSKMAAKFYGSSSKAYRDAIVAANPSLKADPNRIMAGERYVIPAMETTTATPAQTAAPKNEPKATPKEKSAPSNDTYYTVKPGDSLWAIARDQCGDPAAVAAIQELNKDALKGGTSVRAGTKLKLPNKPVASAN